MNKEVLDLEDVMERVQDDMELLLELLDIFHNDFLEKRKKITRLVKEGDCEHLRDLAHSLKGAAGNISAKSLFASFLKLEKMAEEKKLVNIDELLSLIDRQFQDLSAAAKELKTRS